MFNKNLFKKFSQNFQSIVTQQHNTQYVIGLNEPKFRNALSDNILKEINSAIDYISTNQQIKTLVIKSTNQGFFCAGANLKERLSKNEDETRQCVRNLRNTFQRITDLQIPSFALIDGFCLGGGLELAISCDFRIGTQESLLGLPETSLAIIPGAGGTQKLQRIIGLQKAKKMIMLGEKIKGQEAYDIGLLDYIVSDYNELNIKMQQLQDQLDSLGIIGIKSAKQAITEGYNLNLKEGLQIEDQMYEKVLHTEDRKEGLQAFKEKRKPIFKEFNASTTTLIGDIKPYCNFPEKFVTSLQPYAGQVDLQRYAGLWYEVVRKAGIEFQDQCLCVTAEYTQEDSYIGVKNTCGLGNRGSFSDTARAFSWNDNNTTLKVYFDPQIGDSNYQWAVVGDPCRDYFWILSRTPTLNDQIIEQQLQLLKSKNFDISQLRRRKEICPE